MNLNHIEYDHISFDLWLTLIRSHPEFKLKRNLLFRDFFKVDCSIENIASVISYYDVLCNKINEKTGNNIDTNEIYYLILNQLNIKIYEIDTIKLDQFYIETEALFFSYRPQLVYPKINCLFDELKSQDKTMNILSNTAFIKGRTLRKLLAEYGFENHFAFQIYSDEVGFSKPNYKIFQLVYDQINKYKKVTQHKVLHIGDNIIADYNGAKSYGFDAVLLTK